MTATAAHARPAVLAAGAIAALALDVNNPKRCYFNNPVSGLPLVDQHGQRAYWDLLGRDSDAARAYDRSVQTKRAAKPAGQKLTPEEFEDDNLRGLAAITTGWHLVGLNGQAIDIPFSTDNAVALLNASGMLWLREQVERFLSEPKNYAPTA